MPAYWGQLSRWKRLREWVRIIIRSRDCREGPIALYYPPGTWYEEHAGEMLRLLVETTGQLERALGLTLPPTDCYVMEPEAARSLTGTTGVAYRRSIVIGFPARHMSEFAGTAAHELAHILSYRLGKPEPRFLAEGFACYAAQLIGADAMPLGVPLHYHPAWLLSVGVKLLLTELWQRRDYTPELYDLAWSFAGFLVQRFGRERYFAFYASREKELSRRIEDTLGLPMEQLEREWHDHSRERHRIAPARGGKWYRYPGTVCSRAAWLRKQGLTSPVRGLRGGEAAATSAATERAGSHSALACLPLLLPVLAADKYDRCPIAGAGPWRAGPALRKLPPALTAGGLRARILAEVNPDESPENAPRRQ